MTYIRYGQDVFSFVFVFEVEVLVERGLAGPSGLVGQVLRTVCSRVRANLLSNYLSLAAFTIAFRIFQLCSGLIFSIKQSDSL